MEVVMFYLEKYMFAKKQKIYYLIFNVIANKDEAKTMK